MSQRVFSLSLAKHNMVRCLERKITHQPSRDKERCFCLKARDYVEHEIDEDIGCNGYQNLNEDWNAAKNR